LTNEEILFRAVTDHSIRCLLENVPDLVRFTFRRNRIPSNLKGLFGQMR